jgi:serine/threonine protein kinase
MRQRPLFGKKSAKKFRNALETIIERNSQSNSRSNSSTSRTPRTPRTPRSSLIKSVMPFVDKQFYNSERNMDVRVDTIRNLLRATNLLVEPQDEAAWLEQTSKLTRVSEQEGSFAEIYMGSVVLQKKTIPCVLKKLNTRKYIESEITNYIFIQKLCAHGVCNIINVHIPEKIDEPIQILMHNCGKTVKMIKEEFGFKSIHREWMINICLWGLDLCKILECIHSNNMAYLDLRPENIVIHNKKAKLIDFGLSRFGKETEMHVAGSAYYLPPEMALYGECHFNKSDIFSFGVLLYHLLLPSKIDPSTSKPLNLPILGSALIRETIDYTLSKINKDWQSLPESSVALHNAYNNISYFDVLLYKNWINEKTYTTLTTGAHRRIFLLIRRMTLIDSILRPSIPIIKIELEEVGYSLGSGFTKQYRIGWE